uniref:CCHC-type domain-containing protein n=1 Tax=Anopheles epiroticus TaxID=199890 RepID=A0A182PX22_9DIPT
MTNKEEAIMRQLTALEGAVQGLLSEARSGKVDPAMASIKLDLLQSLWNDGNKALLDLEESQGPQPRRATFMEAYAQTKLELKTPGPNRSDHLPRIELPRFNGDPTEWPAFAGRFEKRVAGLTGDAERYAFLVKCFERCDVARNSCEAFENSGMPFSKAWTGESGIKPTVVEDGLLVQLVLGKLDDDTITRVTRRLDAQTIPTWKELREELDRLSSQIYYEPRRREAPRYDRAQSTSKPARQPRMALSATTGTSPHSKDTRPSYKGVSILHGQEVTRRCYACDKLGHVGTLCPELRARSAFERLNLIMGKGKCVNCFSSQHPTAQCPSVKRCQPRAPFLLRAAIASRPSCLPSASFLRRAPFLLRAAIASRPSASFLLRVAVASRPSCLPSASFPRRTPFILHATFQPRVAVASSPSCLPSASFLLRTAWSTFHASLLLPAAWSPFHATFLLGASSPLRATMVAACFLTTWLRKEPK